MFFYKYYTIAEYIAISNFIKIFNAEIINASHKRLDYSIFVLSNILECKLKCFARNN